MTTSSTTDVLVVGGGPAGCSAAIRLATAGHQVTVVERRTAASEPAARGDLLVPSALWELEELGVSASDTTAHSVLGTRIWHGNRSRTVRWPDGGGTQRLGIVLRRAELDDHLIARARAAGAQVLLGTQATTPIVERGFARGAMLETEDGRPTALNCRFLVVADGANSRFGRGLGTNRDRRWPYAVSASTYVTSPDTANAWIETNLGLPDANGNPVTGHGWVHPVGDGTLNVGVTVLSSYRDVLGINIVKLLDSFCATTAERWHFDPEERLVEPTRRRTPVGGSVTPSMGPTFLVAGDAAGMANPFNSHGVRAALTTGRVAAEVLDEALTVGNSTTLQQYPARLEASFGQYHKVGRLSARFLGRPWVLRTALTTGIRSQAAMGAALRLATNELRETDRGGAERAYRLASVIAKFAPSW